MDAVRGRTAISQRAFTRAFAAIAADELGVDAGAPRVSIADRDGRLAVGITAPIALRPRADRPLLAVAESARVRVLEHGAAMTGAVLGSVTVRLDSAEIAPPERVR